MKSVFGSLVLTALVVVAQATDHCQTCKLGFSVLQRGVMKSNASAADIEDGLHKLCDQLPESLASECSQLVATYGRELFHRFTEITAEQFCSDTSICSSSFSTKRPEIQAFVNPLCPFCKTMATTVYNNLKRIFTKTVDDYKKVCKAMPSTEKETECAKKLINMAMKMMDVLKKFQNGNLCQQYLYCPS